MSNIPTKRKILAVSGSTRLNSTNEAILKFIADRYAEVITLELYKDIAKLPHFNPDINDEAVTEEVKDFRERIAKADGILICSPEYVFSLPGVLKNAIEWTVSTTVFSNKPAAFIIASGVGEKAYESLLLILITVGAQIGEHAKLLLKGARSKVNGQGEITDQGVVQEIDKLIHSLLQTINSYAIVPGDTL